MIVEMIFYLNYMLISEITLQKICTCACVNGFFRNNRFFFHLLSLTYERAYDSCSIFIFRRFTRFSVIAETIKLL